jgi:hypothetical protein
MTTVMWAPGFHAPQAYLSLDESVRQAVQATVRARLAPLEMAGRYTMNVEVPVGSGSALGLPVVKRRPSQPGTQ